MSAVATAPVRFAERVPAELAALAGARDRLAVALRECGWSDEDAFRVLVCADEAMANALTHGSAAGGTVAVRFAVTPDTTRVAVADRGARTLPPAGPAPADSDEHGRGLILMRALADRLVVRTVTSGTIVHMDFTRERS